MKGLMNTAARVRGYNFLFFGKKPQEDLTNEKPL